MHSAPRNAPGGALRCASALALPLVMLLILLFAAPHPAAAVDATPPLPTPQLQQRYVALTQEFRCMQCLTESIANSDANLAVDMRLLVHNLVLEGKTDQQVRDYMVSRYGEFILMKPPFSWPNAWLWGAPGALMLVGALAAWRVVRARNRLVDQDDSEVVDDTLLDEPPPERAPAAPAAAAAALAAAAPASPTAPGASGAPGASRSGARRGDAPPRKASREKTKTLRDQTLPS